MIDNNILQSLGAGSGIDTVGLTKSLVEIERAAPQQRIDSKRDKAETQISDFGLMSNVLATLQDAADVLSDPEGLYSKSAAFTQSDALVPVELDTDVQAGTYNFTVEAIASSQSLTSVAFSDPEEAVGEGTLTFNFGNATVDGSGAMLTTPGSGFTADALADSVEITIDSANNSLEGLRDAINDADFGVQASIVNDGLGGYLLQVTAESGANNELEISVSETSGTIDNTDGVGLSRFSFNETASQLAQKQEGADAELTINGLTVYRESNTIDDIVQGLKLDVLQAEPGALVTITITDDKTFAEQNIRDFVEAYNIFLEAIAPAVGLTEVEDDEGETEKVLGSLANDPLAKSMLSQIRSVMANAIPGLSDANFTSLAGIGIRTDLDGNMSIDEETFTRAFENNFEDVQKLFSPYNSTSDNSVSINNYNSSTLAGDYEVVVTTPPSRGSYDGDALTVGFPSLDTTGRAYSFEISVDGKASASLAIPEATYDSADDMATALTTLINSDTTISEAGSSVTVEYNSDLNRFDIISDKYGASSTIEITAADAQLTTELGLSVKTGTDGVTVAGTIDGVEGFGSGKVLLPKLGEPAQGLALIIGDSATSATVSFSRGFAGELSLLIDNFVGSNGLIATRESNLETSIDALDGDQEKLDRRMSSYEERLINQFIAMERIINSLNSSGSFLDNLINTLPFTASRD